MEVRFTSSDSWKSTEEWDQCSKGNASTLCCVAYIQLQTITLWRYIEKWSNVIGGVSFLKFVIVVKGGEKYPFNVKGRFFQSMPKGEIVD